MQRSRLSPIKRRNGNHTGNRSGKSTAALVTCLSIISVLFAAGTWTAARATAPAPATLAPTVVGIVNLEGLMNNLSELKQRNEMLAGKKADWDKQLKELEGEVVAIESELKDKIPKTDRKLRLEKSRELLEKRNSYEFRQKRLAAQMSAENAEVIQDLYIKVTAAVHALAEKDGIDLIMLDDRSIGVPEDGSMGDVNNAILNKRILFAGPKLDLTERLVTIMNNDFAAGGVVTGR